MSEGTALERFPNSAFGVPLGLAGHAILWKIIHNSPWPGEVISDAINLVLWLSSLSTFAVVSTVYTMKAVLHSGLVCFEARHPLRAYSMCMPHLVIIMLVISVPPQWHQEAWMRSVWVCAFVLQSVCGVEAMNRWMFSDRGNIRAARSLYLLATIGWFLLCVLGQQAHLSETWGIDLPALCFGIGVFVYTVAAISIVHNLSSPEGQSDRGHPSLFLLIAPPSVSTLCLEGFQGSFGIASTSVFGVTIFLLAVLLRLCPQLYARPAYLGMYWPYTFPLAAQATAAVKYANTADTVATRVLAVILVCLATLLLLGVCCRMSWHQICVLRGTATWDDPLEAAYRKSREAKARRSSREEGQHSTDAAV